MTSTLRAAPTQAPHESLRTREPRGILNPTSATARLAPLLGRRIGAVRSSLGRAVLTVDADPAHLVILGGSVLLITAGGVQASPPLAGDDATAALASWAGSSVSDLRVDSGGGLRLGVGPDRLVVPADPIHEAWEIRGMDGGLLVCLPGGQISLWAPTFGDIPVARRSR